MRRKDLGNKLLLKLYVYEYKRRQMHQVHVNQMVEKVCFYKFELSITAPMTYKKGKMPPPTTPPPVGQNDWLKPPLKLQQFINYYKRTKPSFAKPTSLRACSIDKSALMPHICPTFPRGRGGEFTLTSALTLIYANATLGLVKQHAKAIPRHSNHVLEVSQSARTVFTCSKAPP